MDERTVVGMFAEGASILKGKATMRETRNISHEAMESIYDIAHDFYTRRKYQDAEKSFELLCLYDHINPKYWQGLGYSRQMLKKYKEAAAALGYASLYLDEYNPELHLGLAECLIMSDNADAAKACLQELLEKDVDKKIKDRAQLLQEQLNENE